MTCETMHYPAQYAPLTEDERTYTEGGDALWSVLSFAAGGLVVGNLIWGLDQTSDWLRVNRRGQSSLGVLQKAVRDTKNYVSESWWNALVAGFTAINLTVFAPVTLIAWVTA